jgi:hypothetical protein
MNNPYVPPPPCLPVSRIPPRLVLPVSLPLPPPMFPDYRPRILTPQQQEAKDLAFVEKFISH